MTNLLKLLSNIVDFNRSHKSVAAMIWLTSIIIVGILSLPLHFTSLWQLVIGTVILSVFPHCLLIRYEKLLEARIAADSKSPPWKVHMNSIPVGEISDAEYASIRQSVFFDSRVYVAQLLNLGRIALKILDSILMIVPLGAFWFVVGCFFFAPDYLSQIQTTLHNVNPAQTAAAIPVFINVAFTISFIIVGIHLVLDTNIGFINHFEQETRSYLRRELGCAADGEVLLSRIHEATDNEQKILTI